MVTAHFIRFDGREVHKVWPVPSLRAADGTLRAGPKGEEAARYGGGVWNVSGDHVPRCVIHASTCIVRYEGDSPIDATAHGPFDTVDFVDGSAFAHPGRRLLARLDEDCHEWYSYEDKRGWPNLVVEWRADSDDS
jgi:hypothetical protein